MRPDKTMQTTTPTAPSGHDLTPHDLRAALEPIIRLHGLRRVLLTALLTGRPRKRRQTAAHHLSAHLQRDIGLGPAPTAPPPVEFMR